MTRSLLALAFVVPLIAAAPAFAQESDMRPKIHVTGEGEVRVAPDTALVTLSVLKEAATAREAMDENNAAMAAVIAALKEEGIEAKDLQTSGLSINPQYVYPDGKNGEDKPRITGYQVTNTLSVRVRDIEKVGAVLDRAVSLGVNQGGNIVFTNDDPASVLGEARKKAVEDAMAKARELAEAAGAEVGKVLRITESGGTPPPMPMMKAARMEAMVASAPVPVEAGENAYRVNVNVTFELLQN
ncbi:SIMPL domain-containing protein [Chelativorans composti]|jgi:uncharacterized protein YggE|uniref:SIMPL domain-containing protein n=1 Tax=Chelativorans composti TaxID=768533 RepID=A0ABW5DIG7_9HYPH|nr:SIMPL domain-containing protein [bacterium SGD-2]